MSKNPYDALIAEEETKLAAFCKFADETRASFDSRIKTLKAMRDGDGLDDFIRRRISAASQTASVKADEVPPERIRKELPLDFSLKLSAGEIQDGSGQPRARKGHAQLAFLEALEAGNHTIETIRNHLATFGVAKEAGATRTGLWTLKNEGYVDSEAPGQYAITKEGRKRLAILKGSVAS